MIVLKKGQSAEQIIVTLNEKRTLESGYYLFIFTHITTRNLITRIYSFLDDESEYQDRYNQFEIATNDLFADQPIGQWNYDVYEQGSDSNTDPDGLTLVETGIMKLKPASDFEFEKYNEQTSFKTYAG